MCVKLAHTRMHVWHQTSTSIHICNSNIQPSVLSVALAPDQYSSNGCYNSTRPTGLYLTVFPKQQQCLKWLHPNNSHDGNEHLKHALTRFLLIHCTP